MKRIYRTPGSGGGFSLLEVMIAVVVLATGMLALAALQASLTRSSAEAKVRGRVASLLSARMDELRVQQYDSATTLADDSCTTDLGTADWVPATFCQEVGIGALTASQTVTTWSSEVGAATFTENRAPTADDEPQFKRATLSATWTDAANATHSLSMTSELSDLALKDSLLPPPPGSGTPTGAPVVRTDNPAGPGVIPIAVGGGDATAASNPRPEVIGKNNNQSIVGTRFDVLTYSGVSGESVIQRRVETSAIKCECKYGVGGDNLPVIYRTSEWPAIWTGERYEVYQPDPEQAAPGAAFASGPKPNVTQSALCQECCRDHHDGTSTTVAKYDPERSSAHSHYSVVNKNLVIVPDTSNSDYVEACRLIRVDGFWRTASDMYSRHFGLLATQTVDGKAAKTGVPDTTAVASYQTFVKDYLGGYNGTVATAPAGADALFAEPARGLDEPQSISIDRPAPQDERYLHGRGLYVDYLEQDARDKIVAVLQKCPVSADSTECMLPYLPFTTINVTELAFWTPKVGDVENNSIISVATGSSLIYDPTQPTRGRTNALAGAAGDPPTADAVAEMGISNSGVAVAAGVDLDDETEKSDRQVFVVGGTPIGGDGEAFSVRVVSGLPQVSDSNTSNDPAIAWAVGTDTGNCGATVGKKDTNPNDYVCTTFGTLGVPGSVTLGNYFREYDVTQTITATCGGQSATASVDVPTFENYRVSAASIGGVGGTIGAPSADGKTAETTNVVFASISADSRVDVEFALEGTTSATITSCSTNGGGNQISNIVWSRPWTTP